jgi:hypothetical protein
MDPVDAVVGLRGRPPWPVHARVVRPRSLYGECSVVATLPGPAPSRHLEIMPGIRRSLLIGAHAPERRAAARGSSRRGRTAVAGLVILASLAAPWGLIPGHERGGASRGSCSARGCLCHHGPGHSDACPCCANRSVRTESGASVLSCHCARDREPATVSAPEGEGILAELSTLQRSSQVDTLASGREDPGPEVATDPPEPVPRDEAACV